MTKREALKAAKLLEANDWRESELMSDGRHHWIVFATANNGYRMKFESLSAVEGRLEASAFYRAAYGDA